MYEVTLRHLRYAVAVDHHRHFGRAAAACTVSQPALSMQIRELETILGSVLFERSNRTVRTTNFGEAFLRRARDVLRSVDDLGELGRAAREGYTGGLRLGVIPTIAPYLLPALMPGLTATFPDIEVTVRESVTQRLIDDLTDGRLDAAIVALPVSEQGLTELELFTEEFVLIRHADDRDAPLPDRSTLREMRLLLLEEGHCFRQQALSFCELRADGPREVLDASTLTTLVQMVAAGMGVTLIPEIAVATETRLAHVHVVRFTPPRPTRTVGLIWRASNPSADHFRRIGEVVRHCAGVSPTVA